MCSSIMSQDQNHLTSKILFTYDLSNVQNERRSVTPTQSVLNTEVLISLKFFFFDKFKSFQVIQMDLRTMSKETQSTIEQIQRWIKSKK